MTQPIPPDRRGSLESIAFRLPLRVPFRGVRAREGMLIRGARGWGEFAPFAEYSDADCVPWLRAAREAAAGDWPAPVRATVPVNAIVPAVDPGTAADLALAGGCTTVKVKVAEAGQSLRDDCDRVAAVRDAIGPDGRIRIDANGAWSVTDAVDAIGALDRAAAGLEYVEQPCASVADLAAVRRRVAVPIAADESIRRAADPLAVAAQQAADIVVLKPAPLGGVRACLDLAERIGLPVVVSSAADSSIGLGAAVALAAALPELPYACGLGTGALLAADLVTAPLLAVGGRIAVPATPAEPDPDLLAAASPDSQTAAAWQGRLERVAALLAASSG